jgi:hypothetical protein
MSCDLARREAAECPQDQNLALMRLEFREDVAQ